MARERRARLAREVSSNETSKSDEKKAMPMIGSGIPSGLAHADARTVSQPVSAQNVGAGESDGETGGQQ